jgi:dimethylargininase
MEAPATLDGGDCLLLDRRLYVGVSSRTNPAGIARAREVFGARGIEVIDVEVHGALHLKSVCSPLGGDAVLVLDGALPRGTFGGARELSVSDAAAANVVVVGRHALVAAGFDTPVADIGLTAIAVDNSELRRADSALTCLSILVDR